LHRAHEAIGRPSLTGKQGSRRTAPHLPPLFDRDSEPALILGRSCPFIRLALFVESGLRLRIVALI
jgi:hypothetical protein